MGNGAICTEELEQNEVRNLKGYALRSAERRQALGSRFREHKETAPLEYRTEYHRDRDRILWSSAFRRLQHKTQIFPHYAEDHYRRRLTHSLEVAQIACTLCRALGLNEVAAEAIALGHDLGHAPFGHGGEEALNRNLLAVLTPSEDDSSTEAVDLDRLFSTPVLLFGFNHCVQGVEQVSRVSDEYPSYAGLNLSFDIRDGILKHIYDKPREDAIDQRVPFASLENIVKLAQFADFRDNCGSLEAQCVWFADKVAYLLGDMEDALRANIFGSQQLQGSSLVQRLWENSERKRYRVEDLQLSPLRYFLAFKRAALTVLILDCISKSTERLREANPGSPEDVLARKERLVDVGEELREAWDEFYHTLVSRTLFRHDSVRACEFKARTIVDGLFSAYRRDPDLVPTEFHERTQRAYNGLLDSGQMQLMAIRNYLAGMTDSFATDQHRHLYMSSERAGLL